MTKMQSTDYADWRKWAQDLEEQVKRIDWAKYDWREVSLNAFLYQWPDVVWGQNILTEKMEFQDAVANGIHHLTAKGQAKELARYKRQSHQLLSP